MPPTLALVLTTIGIAVLFRMDRHVFARRSVALWLPLVYAFILNSRLPSQWIALQGVGTTYGAYQEGNALDRWVYLALLLASIWVLMRRPHAFSTLLRSQWVLAIFVVYGFVSIAWADLPFIAFKRWIRDLGIYATVCVVATDADPASAARLFFRRSSYLLLPLSVLVIKYYPEIGRQFEIYSGRAFQTGIATSKNGLGATAVICGLFLVWDCFANIRGTARPLRSLGINLVLLSMAVWLLMQSDSATSKFCFVLGVGYLAFVYLIPAFKAATLSRVFIWTILLYFPLDQIFGLTSIILELLGRDATFTGRTDIWNVVMAEVDVPLIGAGYESFWAGSRLMRIWRVFHWMPNQAHNGYLEVYLNLGLIGLVLIAAALFTSYRNVRKALSTGPEFSRFAMAFLLVFLPYNHTEAALKSHSMWYAMLVVAMAVTPVLARKEATVALRRNPSKSPTARIEASRPARSAPAPSVARQSPSPLLTRRRRPLPGSQP